MCHQQCYSLVHFSSLQRSEWELVPAHSSLLPERTHQADIYTGEHHMPRKLHHKQMSSASAHKQRHLQTVFAKEEDALCITI